MISNETYIAGDSQTDFSRNWTHDGKDIPDVLTEVFDGVVTATDVLPSDIGSGHVVNFAPELYATQGHLGAFLVQTNAKSAEGKGAPFVLPHTRRAITDAFGRAWVANVWELDAVETHDCFTTSEHLAIDDFGPTAPGESWKAIEEGAIDFLGCPAQINPSSGLICAGHPVGATGVRQLLGAFRQVRGSAGDYQVEGARRGVMLNIDRSGTTSVPSLEGGPQ